MSRYDIILVQEVQDRSERTIFLLKKHLNRGTATSDRYEVIASCRVGRSSGEMEQYAVYYRPAVVTLIDSFHYDDPEDVFSRDPFVTHFQFRRGRAFPVLFVVLHAKPDGSPRRLTVTELDALGRVYDAISEETGIRDVLLMGDFNAGGRYVRPTDWPSVRLRTRPEFRWLIDDGDDTTVGDTTEAYDRIVVAGDDLQHAVVDAGVYRFADDTSSNGRRMTIKEALAVSDHFPVEVTLKLQPETGNSDFHCYPDDDM